MKFTDLGLDAAILRAVADQGYDTPTPIQAQAIPVVLARRDLMAAAQTGTGKTAGFVLPMLQLLSQDGNLSIKRFKPRALVLAPTRELAIQVQESVKTYGKHLKLRSTPIFGGVGIGPQTRILKAGVDIVVATPGRLLDHVNQRGIDLSGIEILVLDEADRMLDMGFIRDIRKILSLLPKKKQSLLFSATFSDEIRGLATGLLDNPASVEVARRNAPAEAVAQCVYHVDRERKRDLLIRLIEENQWHQVLVFTRTKHGADALAERLAKAGISAAALHGNKSQGQRQRALEDFKRLKTNVLVATDIAARGIDIDELPHVVNYELPNVPEDYVHRIGRTGRAGSSGEATSLVCIDEHKLLRDIERVLKREIEKRVLPGFEPDPRIKAEPIMKPRGSGSGRTAATPGKAHGGFRPPQPAKSSRKAPARGGLHHSGSRHQ
ncbi:DEAD/DEAH box helicase [Sulfurisoma sediminicola]|uniref:DEAD-box ATP-dependent RNA helicase RhpA n=1 Tax=Sulfurisoma sediminicola TaxID=1381557 RepID=A0A497XJN6_9PROT|nr:DEAD/DEAH box helicase [Sulfurisoma sediminicola]RLJ67476.1 ATP-dependent RNA helicase RhlE [Sulfurisoma sediminicola]